MTDPLTWSIDLGRWAGIRVRVHVLLVLFAFQKLLEAAWTQEKGHPHPVFETVGWLCLLVLAIVIKQSVTALVAGRVGMDRDEFRLWPLGHLGGPGLTAAERSPENVMVLLSGMLTSLTIALVVAIILGFAGVQMVFNPFGNVGSGGAPLVGGTSPAAPFHLVWWLGWFGHLNWVLFVANLIPAIPLDAGRIFRSVLAARSRDGMIGPWTAHSCAAVLAVVGIVRWLYFKKPGGGELISLAFLIEFFLKMESSLLEEGGFFEEGVFGYDFSQGYTSLEAGAAAVKPRREGALKRWRRRRSDLHRRRKAEKEAADDRRMDELLDKIHREGRSVLSDEEQRFLVRVSAQYKKRVRGT